uniref:Uncharacterized protein n=1 Tax=Oryza brachyantha TaxID=4533 RepID=J3L5X6_ORYBR
MQIQRDAGRNPRALPFAFAFILCFTLVFFYPSPPWEMATVAITRYGCVEWHRCYCRFVLCSSDFCSCEVEESAGTGGGALLSSNCSAIGHGRESESIIDAIALLGRHVRPRLPANIQILQMDDIIEE